MTLREQMIQALIAQLSAVPGFPAAVDRSIVTAFTRDESPVLVIHRGAEDPDNSLIHRIARSCEILVSVITRSDVPDQVVDTVMEVAHPIIMAFAHAGLTGVLEDSTLAPIFASADANACMITTKYLFQYRTSPSSLTS